MPADRRIGRWYVIWRYSRPDPMAWVALAAGLFFTVFSMLDGWTFGAALGGFQLGAMSIWWAFVSNHFRMTERSGDDDAR